MSILWTNDCSQNFIFFGVDKVHMPQMGFLRVLCVVAIGKDIEMHVVAQL
jgi:hypothetical protein